jgi:hydrogenase/urease accessory protein HupE
MHSLPFQRGARLRDGALRVCALALLLCGGASGHDVQTSRTTVRLNPDSFELSVTMHGETVRSMIQAEAPRATLEPENFDNVRPLLATFANDLYEVSAGGRRLTSSQTDVTLDGDNLQFRLLYPRPPDGPVRLTAVYLSRVAPGFVANVRVEGVGGRPPLNKILNARDPSVVIESMSGAAEPGGASGNLFLLFLRLGVEHILTGYDHLLFLLGLLIACRRFSTMALVITCFTLAHSVTLALAALGVFALSPAVVEPLIAASILFVGVENLLRKDEPRWRWALTLAFGLVHGFGFAGALKEAGLGSAGASLLVPLFSFNLGVELGQVGVAAVVLPLLWRLRRWPPYQRRGQLYISLFVVLAGGYWLVRRLFF